MSDKIDANDSIVFLTSWAADIRGSSGTSVDADSLEHAATTLEQAVSALTASQEEVKRLRSALEALLSRDERNTCQHENTHRGGFLWEICDECGAKWADDEGGKPEWKDPAEWIAARAALDGEGK